MPEVIAAREFSTHDILWFAAASGDWNPIHVDNVQARRTIAGKVVVHGMFSLLWALDSNVKAGGGVPFRIQVFFRQPVHPGERVELRRYSNSEGTRLAIVNGITEHAVILLSGNWRFEGSALLSGRPAPDEAEVIGLDDIKGSYGSLKITADVRDLLQEFPTLSAMFGSLPVATILTCSRLVGMTCPGLHSLFTGLDLTFTDDPEPTLNWHVGRIVSPFAPLSIGVHGGGVTGQLSAFIRPPPVKQAAMVELAGKLSSSEFSGKRALIIGGSRGLGELTAKLLASAGCDVFLSYRSGQEDAEKIVAEIQATGGNALCFQFDVSQPENLLPHILNHPIDLLFYYATPNIARQPTGQFDHVLYQTFLDTYVTSYEKLVRDLMSDEQTNMWALYPSTVFAEAAPDGFSEYTTAKKQGELLCRTLELQFPLFHAVVERFPRLATDQTATLIPQKTESATEVLIDALNRLAEQIKVFKS